MFWPYSPFLQQFFLNPVLFPHSPNVSSCFVKVGFCFVLFLSTPRTICAVQMFFDVWISTGAWPTYWSRAPLLKKIDPSFPSILQLSIAHQKGLEYAQLPSPGWDLAYWTGPVHAVAVTEIIHADACCAQKTVLPCSHQLPLAPRTLPSLLTEWLRRGDSVYDPFRVKHSVVFYSLHLSQVWVSVLTTIYCKQNFSDEGWEIHWSMCVMISH